jgi:hypothetical protein
MTFEDGLTIGVDLAVKGWLYPGPLKAEVKTTDAGEE